MPEFSVAPPQGRTAFLNTANVWRARQQFLPPGDNNYVQIFWNNHAAVGVYDTNNNLYYGIFAGLPAPGGSTGIGGYYHGVGVGGSSHGTDTPIFGVLADNQSSDGMGQVSLTIYDTNKIETFNNIVDDGSGNTQTNPGTTDLAGTTAGHVYWAQPERGTRKVFIAVADGYENDTTTNQTITFPTSYTYNPAVSINTTGLTVKASTTTLTITAPDSTTTYSGVVEVVGI